MTRQPQSNPPNPLPVVERAVQRLSREITQEQIVAYDALLKRQAAAKAALKALDAEVETYEGYYTDALRKGYTQEDGDLTMVIMESTRQAPVAWKEKYAEVAGARAVEQAQSEVGQRTYTHIGVHSGLRTAVQERLPIIKKG